MVVELMAMKSDLCC